MGAFSNDLEAKLVEHFLRNTAQTSPATVYLALFESNPAEDGSGNETAFAGYTRIASTWTALDGTGQTKNAGSITFPANANAADPVTITHIALFDAATVGNMLIYGALTAAKIVEVSDVLAFAANAIALSVD